MSEEIHYLIKDGETLTKLTKALKETLDSIEKLLQLIESEMIIVVKR